MQQIWEQNGSKGATEYLAQEHPETLGGGLSYLADVCHPVGNQQLHVCVTIFQLFYTIIFLKHMRLEC